MPEPVLFSPPDPENTPDCVATPLLLIVINPAPLLMAPTAIVPVPAGVFRATAPPPVVKMPVPEMLPVPVTVPPGSLAVRLIAPPLVVMALVPQAILLPAWAVRPMPAPAIFTAELKVMLLLAWSVTLAPAPLIDATLIVVRPAILSGSANWSTSVRAEV